MKAKIGALGLVAALALGLACENEDAAREQPTAPSGVELLSPTQHLLRVTMALSGVRPTPEELDAVRADPGALPAIADRHLAGSGFAATVRDLYNEALQVR